VLGNEPAAEKYDADAAALAKAIHAKFFVPASSGYLDTRQTHLVMPLIAGVVPAEHKAGVWAALRKEILATQASHFDTGLHGTYFMTKLLTDTSLGFGGGDDLLYAMATQASYPGYGDLLAKGYTTWPESWGTRKPGTAVRPPPHSHAAPEGPRQPYLEAANWTSGPPSHGRYCHLDAPHYIPLVFPHTPIQNIIRGV
jgi:hypothetical protein